MKALVAAAAMMMLSAPPAAAQTGSAPFCLKTATGQLSCTFGTMGECEQAKASTSADQCITRSDAGGTTGLGDRSRPVTPPVSPSEQSPAPER
jgi:hypothetical protein